MFTLEYGVKYHQSVQVYMTSFFHTISTEEDIDGCGDNLIDNGDLLTSGYRSDIDNNDQTGSKLLYYLVNIQA